MLRAFTDVRCRRGRRRRLRFLACRRPFPYAARMVGHRARAARTRRCAAGTWRARSGAMRRVRRQQKPMILMAAHRVVRRFHVVQRARGFSRRHGACRLPQQRAAMVQERARARMRVEAGGFCLAAV